MNRNLKLYPSPPDSRDYTIKITATKTPAPTVDLSAKCTTIKDKGSIGACTAFAGVSIMEYIEKKYNDNKTEDIFSERFTYYTTRVNVLG
jgi:hypothetical protein